MPLSKDKKKEYFVKMTKMLETYNKVFVVEVDNVGSQQMNKTRLQMRGSAEILMGKNTLMRKVLKSFMENNPGHFFDKIEPKLRGNVGFVFTNADLPKVRDMILANRVPAPARVGSIAPVEVSVPAGPTGCDPGQTSFFQVLQIPTKIVKGQIEITNPVNLIKKGDKVGSSEAALLTKLNIRPFSYGLAIDVIFDQGQFYPVDVLDIDDNVLTQRFAMALSSVAALSLQINYPTQASLPHSIANAFKTLVAVTVNLDNYTFEKVSLQKSETLETCMYLKLHSQTSKQKHALHSYSFKKHTRTSIYVNSHNNNNNNRPSPTRSSSRTPLLSLLLEAEEAMLLLLLLLLLLPLLLPSSRRRKWTLLPAAWTCSVVEEQRRVTIRRACRRIERLSYSCSRSTHKYHSAFQHLETFFSSYYYY